MFKWRLTARVEECGGVNVRSTSTYTLVMRFDNHFSAPSDPALVKGNRLRFNTDLTLQFETQNSNFPFQNLQIMLACNCVEKGPKGQNNTNEEIIGLAIIKIGYPLAKELQSLKVHKFDKCLDTKATIRASISLEKQQIYHSSGKSSSQETLPSSALEEILSLQRQKNEAYQNHLKFLHAELDQELIIDNNSKEKSDNWENIMKERNELYKMSEDLYEQLKKCMAERDKYLKELRQKQLSEQQTKEELQFLKLKIEEYEGSQQETSPLLLEMQELRCQNLDLRRQLDRRQVQAKELKRQVKESFVAIDEFRKEALQARSELIHKESELSVMTRQSRHLDPYECIEQLYQQLQNRKLEQPYCFNQEELTPSFHIQTFVRDIKREIAHLFTQLMQKLKIAKDKEWLIQQKVSFQRKIDHLSLI